MKALRTAGIVVASIVGVFAIGLYITAGLALTDHFVAGWGLPLWLAWIAAPIIAVLVIKERHG